MKWLIGIAVVMLLAHLYFRLGARRLARAALDEGAAPPATQAQQQTAEAGHAPRSGS